MLTQMEQFLIDHPSDYVRLLGIDPKAKQRQWEQVIQKPWHGQKLSLAMAGSAYYQYLRNSRKRFACIAAARFEHARFLTGMNCQTDVPPSCFSSKAETAMLPFLQTANG